jgi:hypothetical protein
MNMLSRTFSEGSQNQSSADSHDSPMLTVGTMSDAAAAAAPCSLDLDFLIGRTMRTGNNGATSGPGRGGGGRGGGSSSFTSSDVLNGTLKAL